MNSRALCLAVLLSACVADPGPEDDGDAGRDTAAPAAECAAIDLRTGEAQPDGSLVVRGLGEDRHDVSCPGPPLNGRELVVTFTADRAGVHTFGASESAARFYRLADDCATPVACANTASEWRRLSFDLDAGERVVLVAEAGDEVAVSVAFPRDEASLPVLQAAWVTAGEGALGVVVQYDSDWSDRVAALPWITAVVAAEGGEARVPLTAVKGVGHGLMTAAGVVATRTPLPVGAAVDVRIADERAGGEVRWTSEAVAAQVLEPAPVGLLSWCADGLWTCDAGNTCAASTFVSGADPGEVGACVR
jgi:hypothetical protein